MRGQYTWCSRANQAAFKLILEGKLNVIYACFWVKIDTRNSLVHAGKYDITAVFILYTRYWSWNHRLKWLGRTPISQPDKFDACRIQIFRTNVAPRFQWSAEHELVFSRAVRQTTRRSPGKIDCLVYVQDSAKCTRQYRFSSFNRASVIGSDVNPQATSTYNKPLTDYVRKQIQSLQ